MYGNRRPPPYPVRYVFDQIKDHDEQKTAHLRGERQRHQVAQPDVSPRLSPDLESRENQQLDDDDQRKQWQKRLTKPGIGHVKVVGQTKRQEQTDRKQNAVNEHDDGKSVLVRQPPW